MKFQINNGIDFINSKQEIQWQGINISIHEEPIFKSTRSNTAQNKELKDSDYRAFTAEEIIQHKNQAHLTKEQRAILKKMLGEFECIFEGRPGKFRGLSVQFELKQDAKPFYGKPYGVPEANKAVFKRTLDDMKKME